MIINSSMIVEHRIDRIEKPLSIRFIDLSL